MTKRCCKCSQDLPVTEFYKVKTSGTELRSRCKRCHNEDLKAWQRANPEKRRLQYMRSNRKNARDRHLKYTYGISENVYHQMSEKQGNLCAICREKELLHPNLLVDHDHHTGSVRGLLCSDCNVGLGRFKDSPERLIKAVDYLVEHK